MTTEERHGRITDLFGLVVGLPAAERDEVLRTECGDDADLLQEVHELLAADAAEGPVTTVVMPVDFEGPSASRGLLERLASHRPRSPRHKILSEVARGGMGAILRVWDEDLRRSLAMKVILGESDAPGRQGPVDERLLTRFLEEAQVTGQLDHPGVVPVHELGLDAEGAVFFTMRLVRGRNLKRIIEMATTAAEGWSETRVVGVLHRVCETMAYAHSKGVIHRDLKPANIMVGRFGEVYVMDWGLARVDGRRDPSDIRLHGASVASMSKVQTDRKDARDSDLDSPLITMDGAVVGTPYFMSPEQAAGDIDQVGRRSDVYAIGSMLYFVLSGQLPYARPGGRISPHTVLAMVLQGPPTPLRELDPHVQPELESICNKAMAREQADRYANMSELADDLRAYLEGRVVLAHEAGLIAELKKWIGRNKLLAAAVGVALVVIVAGSGISSVLMARKNRALTVLGYRTAVAAAGSALSANDVRTARTYLAEADPTQREWEWYYLASRVDESDATFFGHTQPAIFVASARDGERIASYGHDGFVRIWDTGSRREVQRIELPRPERTPSGREQVPVAFDADLEVLADTVLLADDATWEVRVWDVASAEIVRSIRPSIRPGGPLSGALDLSRDGRLLAVAGASILVWDLSTSAAPLSIDVADTQFRSVAFDPGGDRLAAISAANELWIWPLAPLRDASTPDPPVRIAEPRSTGQPTFSPDGVHIATTADNGVLLFDSRTGRALGRFLGHTDRVTSLGFDPRGDFLVSASKDRTIRVWGVAGQETIATLLGHIQGCYASFSADGARIFSASDDWTVKSWRVPTPAHRLLVGKTSDYEMFAGSSGDTIAVRRNDRTLDFWNVTGGAPEKRAEVAAGAGAPSKFTRFPWGHAMSPDGRRFARMVAGGDIVEVSTASGAEIGRFVHGEREVHALAYHPGGHLLASAGSDGIARLWSTTGEPGEMDPLVGHEGPVRCVAFDSTGERLVTGGDDGRVRIWNVADRTLMRTVSGAGGSVWSAVLLADGERLATLTWPGHGVFALDFWDLTDQRPTPRRVSIFDGWARSSLVTHPSGSRFLVSRIHDSALPVFDGHTGRKLVDLRADLRPNHGVIGFTGPGGDRLLAYDAYGSLVAFDASPGRKFAQRLDLRSTPAVTELVARLFDEHLFRAIALEHLCARDDLDENERLAAIDAVMADPRTELAVFNGLGHELVTEGRTAAEYAANLRTAEHLCRLRPGDRSARKLLGFAQVRTGRAREALETLADLPDHSTARAFAALAHVQLNDRAGAEIELEKARAHMAEMLGEHLVIAEAERRARALKGR